MKSVDAIKSKFNEPMPPDVEVLLNELDRQRAEDFEDDPPNESDWDALYTDIHYGD